MKRDGDSVEAQADFHYNISLGDPLAASSPKRVTQTTTGNKNKKALRTLIINFQSIKNKRTELPILIETANPDKIIGTETWLSNNIGSREFFHQNLDMTLLDAIEGISIYLILTGKNEIKGNQLPQTINRAYLQMSADLSIQQINDNTTRGNDILDLIFTSHPGNIDRCKTLPPIGNSDHDIVLVDITANVNKPKPTKRKVNLWKKADLESIGKHLDSQYDLFNKSEYDDIDTMWTSIKQIIKESMEKLVPTKRSLARQSHPWMNTHLRRMRRQKQRAYSKAKLTDSPKDWKRYKNIKAELQRESRRAHTKCMQYIVSEDLYKNLKRFWSNIKSRKQESSGITTLKNKYVSFESAASKTCARLTGDRI
ncbi:unnamed protein product [Mytilus edulis]|uniref:Endonuclease/exonuclease/phosphatase domain-containing protein n=1 Tax=Mytilus edulis TaxID=6550 RepID=A0A8S3UJG4_MYTED|nr:unnamed protein product [Mytilus edulis]